MVADLCALVAGSSESADRTDCTPTAMPGYRRLHAERGHYRGVVRRRRGLRGWIIGH
jgi:hypothetical protein